MIVKTDAYSREEVGKVVQLRAGVEGLKLGPGVVEKLAAEGEKSSLRYVILSFSVHLPRFGYMHLCVPKKFMDTVTYTLY